MNSEQHAGNLSLLGGRLCLDFANTIDWRTGEHPQEWLTSYADLVAWSEHAGIVTESEAQHLRDLGARHPTAALAVLEQGIALREAIYRIFCAIADERPPEAEDVATLNNALSEALSRLRVTPAADGFTWHWAPDQDSLDRMLWPVTRSAAELLTSGELSRVRMCAGDDCGWLFFDTSRNRSRRWCSMEDCGNRAKARRHYRRQRALQEPEG
jgi:predicted RNA-binding Zn ribbon-like protein